MKLGVVMEGGASRTIFSCGVTDVLMDENIYPDYFIGVSAGIAYGVSYLSKQRGRNEEFTRKYMHDPRYMGIRHWLNPKTRCYYNLAFDFDEIPNKLVPFDYDALDAFPGPVLSTVTNIETGEAEYLQVPPHETLWETSIASCSLPVLFPPVEIGGNRYLDGGLADSVPYKKALADGCDRVLVILTRERGYQKGRETGTGIIKFAYRKYPNLVARMEDRAERYNRMSEELFEEEEKGNVFVIAPRQTFGVGRTEGDWKKLEPLYREGIDVMRERMDELKAYLR